MIAKSAKALVAYSLFTIYTLCGATEPSQKQVQIGADKPPVIAAGSEKILGDFRNAISDMADKVIPQIVSIQVESSIPVAQEYLDPFEFFFGPGRGSRNSNKNATPSQEPRQQGLGSGVIVSKDGYILTNSHVIDNAENITVTLADKREFHATVVGSDPETDLAVIKLEKAPSDLPVAYLGKSQALRVGEWIVAVGNPFGLSHTVTTGIVSATGVHNRGISSYESFIQVDAAINPGNSGGGLFNLAGELVGINSAILSRSGGFQGIGFAIPIDLARGILSDLVHDGKVSRGWLGVSIQDMDPKLAKALQLDSLHGAVIAEVFANGPAQKAGLLEGDVITKVNGVATGDANSLRTAVAMIRPGEKANLTLQRGARTLNIAVQVSSRDNAAEVVQGADGLGISKEFGVEVGPVTDELHNRLGFGKEERGVAIRTVTNAGLFARAGLQPDDLILQINRIPVQGVSSFSEILRQQSKAKGLILLVERERGRFFVVIER